MTEGQIFQNRKSVYDFEFVDEYMAGACQETIFFLSSLSEFCVGGKASVHKASIQSAQRRQFFCLFYYVT